MDPSVRGDEGSKSVRVCGLELGHGAVLQYIVHDRIFGRQFFKDIRRCRITRLRLLSAGHPQLFKEDRSELLRRGDVEFFSAFLVDLCRQAVRLLPELRAVLAQRLRPDPDPDPLHIMQNIADRTFDLSVEGFHSLLSEPFPNRSCRPGEHGRHLAGIFDEFIFAGKECFSCRFFAEELFPGGIRLLKIFRRCHLRLVAALKRIDQIAFDQKVGNALKTQSVSELACRIDRKDRIAVFDPEDRETCGFRALFSRHSGGACAAHFFPQVSEHGTQHLLCERAVSVF